MLTIIMVTLAYLWNDFLYTFFYQKIFEEKYTRKVTNIGTVILWILQFSTKILPLFILSVELAPSLSYLMLVFHFVHVYVLFRGSFMKKVLALFIAFLVQGFMDFLGLNITSMIAGNYEIFNVESNFTLIAVPISCTTITIGMFFLMKMWVAIEQRQSNSIKGEFKFLLLPISQFCIMVQMLELYSINYVAVPKVIISGFILALLADVYMLTLLMRMMKKNQAERELNALQQQYEREQLRYEQLKERQEETAKIRHDFQNYILMMKQMES